MIANTVLKAAEDMGFTSIVQMNGTWNSVFWAECGVSFMMYVVLAYQITLVASTQPMSPRVKQVFTAYTVILILSGVCGHLTRIIDFPWQLVIFLRAVLVGMLVIFVYRQHILVLARHYEKDGHDDIKRDG